jgi:mannose-6-phosphate isomerase-like protein (cupin superfamily)
LFSQNEYYLNSLFSTISLACSGPDGDIRPEKPDQIRVVADGKVESFSMCGYPDGMKFTVDEFLAKLPLTLNERWKEGVWDVEPFKKGNVSLVFFAPRGTDYQTPHDEDELYFVVRGTGEIVIGAQRQGFEPGDVFFVEAGVPHRFENFTSDFATWAVFF